MDAAQILLLIIVVVLTFLLLILGIQVFFILREFRNTVSKLNKVLDDAGTITESVSTPIASLSTVLTGVKTGLSIAKLFKKTSPNRHAHTQKEEESYGPQQ